VNVERYAREFLESRGYPAGETYLLDCVSAAARVFTEGYVQLKLSDLRALGAMAQWNEREMRPDVLQLIATTGNLPGDAWVMMDAKSVKVVGHREPEREVLPDNVLNWEDVL